MVIRVVVVEMVVGRCGGYGPDFHGDGVCSGSTVEIPVAKMWDSVKPDSLDRR